MENGTLVKLALAVAAVIVLCAVVGSLIPGSPIKALVGQSGSESKTPTEVPGNGVINPTAIPSGDPSLVSANLGMAGALELAKSDGRAASWFSEHAGQGLSKAETGHMDAHGQASEWTLTYVDGLSVMIVQIKNDRVLNCNAYDSSAAIMYGMDPEGLSDTPAIMDALLAQCPDLIIEDDSQPFSLAINAGSDPVYKVEYAGGINRPGFSATINASSGEIVENTYRSVGD